MPAQVRQSDILKKHLDAGFEKSIKAHAHDEVKDKFENLPPGISNGVARLTKCYFGEIAAGKKNAGMLYFRMEGVVVSPETVVDLGVKLVVRGRTTSFMENVFDTGEGDKFVSKDQHIQNLMWEMRRLGAKFSKNVNGIELMTVAAALEKTKPYFRFETTLKEEVKNPDGTVKYARGAWERWYGSKGLEDYSQNDDPTAGATDGGGAAGDGGSDDDGQAAASGDEPDVSAMDDWDELNALASGDGETSTAAGERMIELAVAAGVDETAAREAPSWEAVKNLMDAASNPAEPEPAPAKQGWSKGDVILHYRMDPKTQKPVLGGNKKPLKKVEWEIVAVYPAKKNVDLKLADDGKVTMKAVHFDALEAPPY